MSGEPCPRCGKTIPKAKSIDGVYRWCVVCVVETEGLEVRAKANVEAGRFPWQVTTPAEDEEDRLRAMRGLELALGGKT